MQATSKVCSLVFRFYTAQISCFVGTMRNVAKFSSVNQFKFGKIGINSRLGETVDSVIRVKWILETASYRIVIIGFQIKWPCLQNYPQRYKRKR